MCFNDIKHACGARVRRQSLSCACTTNSGDRECSLSCGTCSNCSPPSIKEDSSSPSPAGTPKEEDEDMALAHAARLIPLPNHEAKDARKMARYSFP